MLILHSSKHSCFLLPVSVRYLRCLLYTSHHDLFGDEVNFPNKNFGGGTVIFFFEFHFLEARTPGKYIFETKDLIIGYDEPLSRPLNLTMERGQKAVLVGANGIGKTTLLKSILGLTPALSGSVALGDYLSIGYFEQEMAPGNTTTCLDEIWKEFPSYTQYQVRSALAKCGLTTKHIESQVRVLSGGEQALSLIHI